MEKTALLIPCTFALMLMAIGGVFLHAQGIIGVKFMPQMSRGWIVEDANGKRYSVK